MSQFILALAALLAMPLAAVAQTRDWAPLEDDGLHDPNGPAIKLLQQPHDALRALSPDTVGNQVRWVDALDRGQIQPRTNIYPETKVRVLDQDILLNKRGSLPLVLFPHKQHSAWLECTMCHDQLFKAKAGANKFSMLQILAGEQCGVCHGAVAFPLTECSRCHRVPNAGASAARPK